MPAPVKNKFQTENGDTLSTNVLVAVDQIYISLELKDNRFIDEESEFIKQRLYIKACLDNLTSYYKAIYDIPIEKNLEIICLNSCFRDILNAI